MRRTARSLAIRLVLLALFWTALTEGSAYGWGFGATAVLAGALLSLRLAPPAHRAPPVGALLRFVGFFLHRSLAGGVDVARRALDPGTRLRPATLEYPLRLPEGAPRVVFAMTLSLLPGTLAAGLGRGTVRVHLLDERMPAREGLVALEERIAALFRLELPAAAEGGQV
jgi:multicomponent Na+:H+ antiporter subunit E